VDLAIERLIRAIHASGVRCVLATTGGGASAIGSLLSIPGGSRTLLEALVPYEERALAEYLGHVPERACSPEVSRAMAARAYDRARWFAPGASVVGLGSTASLATDRPKRGEHRFFVTTQGDEPITTHAVVFRKGLRDRAAEEAIAAAILLNALAEAVGVAERALVDLQPDEPVQVDRQPAGLLTRLLSGEIPALCIAADGQFRTDAQKPAALVPGAFNPVHEAHWGLAELAARRIGGPAAFELSAVNVDKPALGTAEIRRRAAAIHGRLPLWVTRAPTFAEKAALFPGVTFVVGVDTALRIVHPRYYGDSEARMVEALEHIRRQGCRFLVAGRQDNTDQFITLEDVPLPEAFRDLFSEVPRSEFHIPVSSTVLRSQAAASRPSPPSPR
jgi:nicotinamide mononucleotide (NMN) deamidase PncC